MAIGTDSGSHEEVAVCAAELLDWPLEKLTVAAGIPMLLGKSVKESLDIEWADPDAKADAINTVVEQLDALQAWLSKHLAEELKKPPLQDHMATLEPDPSGGGGGTRIRQGVAAERRVSVEDPDMRHGRKSKRKRFHGYMRHVALDLDTGLIVACDVTPANRPEEEAAVVCASGLTSSTASLISGAARAAAHATEAGARISMTFGVPLPSRTWS